MQLLPALAALCVLPLLISVGISALRAPLRVLLPIYAALIPFGSGITVPIGVPPPFNTVTTLAGIAVIVILAARLLLLGGARTIHPSVPAWLLFTGFNGVTFLWSIDRSATLDRFVILTSLVALYAIVLLVPITREDVERLKTGIVVGATAACAYGFVLLLTGRLPEEGAGLPRFATAGGVGDAADPNITAAVLVLPLVLAVSKTMRAERALLRMAYAGATLLIGTGLLLTASRGGLLGALVAVVVLVAHEKRPAVITSSVIAVALVVGAVGFLLAPEQFERLDKPGSTGRTNIWLVGLIACEHYCLTGSGLNTFEDVHRETALEAAEASGLRLGEPPHNLLLGVGVELGILGVVLLLAGLATTVMPLRRLPKLRRGPPLAAITGLLVANIFLANLHFKYFWLALMYAAFEAAAIGDERAPDAEHAVAPAPVRRLPRVLEPA